jgi:hypothetical protein
LSPRLVVRHHRGTRTNMRVAYSMRRAPSR